MGLVAFSASLPLAQAISPCIPYRVSVCTEGPSAVPRKRGRAKRTSSKPRVKPISTESSRIMDASKLSPPPSQVPLPPAPSPPKTGPTSQPARPVASVAKRNVREMFNPNSVSDRKAILKNAEMSVMDDVRYRDGRYGKCHICQEQIAIPGLAHFFCVNCGWVARNKDVQTISPGHHD